MATAARALNSKVSPPPPLASVQQLISEIAPCIPDTFTSLQQISRQLPPDVMEQVSQPSCGGLRALLSRFPEQFESKQIGQVHVARRRGAQNPWQTSEPRSSNPIGMKNVRDVRSVQRMSGVLSVDSRSSLEVKVAYDELQRLFPHYLVPVKALWATVPEQDEAEMRRCVVDAIITHATTGVLAFHEHPAHRLAPESTCKSTRASADKAVNEERRAAVEEGFVMLGPALSAAASHDAVQLGGGGRAECVSTADALCQPSSAHERLADYEVQPYEQYRVARVLPTCAKEVLFDTALHDAAAALLPPRRDVWHVLLSSPHLFAVRYAGSPSVSDSAAPPAAFVQFQLEPRFVPSGVAAAREETLLRELDEVAADREANKCGLNTRQRRRKRKLQRQLAYLRNPTPYFDERVLAQHLFDLLPLRNGVHQSALLGALPPQAVHAFSQNVTELLQERRDLFRLSDARHGVLVQRADAPAEAEAQRSVESVTGEEVLQCIFADYSARSDPQEGTTISRVLSRLPRLVRERLFAMQDVVQDLLCLYPDKVEVLCDAATASSPSGASPPPDARAQRELQSVRGRRDFLVPFRFVGEWQAKLMEKYRKQQEKELAKSRARHRGACAGNRRPRY